MSLEVPFQITSDVRPQVATVAVCGEIDLSNVTELRSILDKLVATTDGDIVIDLSDVSYLDSCGLHELLSAQSHVAALNRRFIVQRPSAVVLRLFGLCDVTEQLTVSSDGDLATTTQPAAEKESPANLDR
jgi:anti-sigma B factor antagonist